MNVCVVALGKIGLPLAVQIASRGHRVVGADIDGRIVELVNAGSAPFREPGLDEQLAAVVAAGGLSATVETTAAVSQSEVVVIVAPLAVDESDSPDYSIMDAVSASVAAGLKPGTLVSYETTLPVGSTRGRFTPALAEGSGLTPGADLFVCHSPERVSSGSVFRDLARYPKLVGGIDDLSAKRAVEFYESVLEFEPRDDLSRPNGVWDLGSSEAAELTKLAETTYRDVNIGLANEFARYADSIDVDVFDVIAAANSQPYSHIHRPGIAVGGHCIPVYPRLYLSNDPTATLPRAARAMNSAMPGYAVDRVEATAGPVDGKTCLILGVAYRGGVKETAFSGAFPLRDELVRRGAAVVSASDPMYSSPELASLGFTALESGQAVDVVFVQTDHASYRDLGPDDIGGATTLFDGRRCVNVERFTTRGVTVIGIGTGAPR